MPIITKIKAKIHANVSDDPTDAGQDMRDRLNQQIQNTKIECVAIGDIKPNRRNAKKHPERQIALLAENFRQFGFTQPVIIDENNELIAGHARWQAALRIGLSHIPAIRLPDLSASAKRALAIADNKLSEAGKWNIELLQEELAFLFNPETELSFDPSIIGFETPEIDQILQGDTDVERADPADKIEPIDPAAEAVTVTGDVWVCGSHKLLCGNAKQLDDYQTLMGDDRADLGFADGPYNVPNESHVTRRGNVREFAMAAGEMSSEAFEEFNRIFCKNLLIYLRAGAVVYLCMDWRHIWELRAAANSVFGALKNLIVWVKTNAGMGSFYRSQHEMILVYVTPGGRPTNNFGLGGQGRHRSNAWFYAGFNSFGRDRDETLAMHPTVKPVALVADALMDCSKRRSIVLDPFGGSGTTMIAAERTGRRARLIEIDPLYCDLIVQRWQKFTGKTACLAGTNESFEEVKTSRATIASTRGN